MLRRDNEPETGVLVNVQQLVGRRMREIREGNEMTQEELGRRLEPLLGTAWSRQQVSGAELGGRAFTAAELVALARTLGVTVTRLFAPPVDVHEVELPGGTVLNRVELLSATLARAPVDHDIAELPAALGDVLAVLFEAHRRHDEASELERAALEGIKPVLNMIERLNKVADGAGGDDAGR